MTLGEETLASSVTQETQKGPDNETKREEGENEKESVEPKKDGEHQDAEKEQQDEEVTKEDENKEDKDEDKFCPFHATPMRIVEVTAGGQKELFYIHEAILNCCDKLHSQVATFSFASAPPVKLELLGSATFVHFANVLDYFYSSSNRILFDDLADAIHTTQIASSLGCHEDDLSSFHVALRGKVCTEEDLALVAQLFKNEWLPVELQVFMESFTEKASGKILSANVAETVVERRCVYTTTIKQVEVSDGQCNAIFFVHVDILGRFSYFASHQARWASMGECPKVFLPEGASPKHFGQILDHLYNSQQWVSFVNVRDAIQVNRVATMLSCDAEALVVLKTALRGALRTDEDVKLLRELSEEEELPMEMQPVARRAAKKRKCDEVSVDELRLMRKNAIEVEDETTLKYVARNLKRRSRRGGAARQEVVDALCDMLENDEREADKLAIEFLTVHPEYYGELIDSWIRNTSYAIELLDLTFKHFSYGAIDNNAFVECTTQLIPQKPLLAEDWDILRLLASFLIKVGAVVQVQFVEKAIPLDTTYRFGRGYDLTDDGVESVVTLSSPLIAQALSYEAKSKLVERMVLLDDEHFASIAKVLLLQALGQSLSLRLVERLLTMDIHLVDRVITSKFLDAVGEAGTRKLLPVACGLTSEEDAAVKKRILESAHVDTSDDSEGGF